MNRSAPPRRTGPPQRRVPLSNGNGLARTGTPRRRARIATKPRRQPAHCPWPMTCPPGFRHEAIAAADYRCARCQLVFPPHRLSLSRIVPGSKGGPYTWWNTRIVCGDGTLGCHGDIEASPEMAERDGWRVPGSIIRGEFVGDRDTYAWYAALVDAAREADSATATVAAGNGESP